METDVIFPGAVEFDLGEFRLIPGPKGETGERGPRGYGLKSAVLNPDYTLTLRFEDGSSYTTPSIRGQAAAQVDDVRLEKGEYAGGYTDKLVVEMSDGRLFEFEIYNRAAEYCQKADEARKGAETARQAIENMTVTSKSLPSGEAATVDKTRIDGFVNLLFGIPRGQQGAEGPRGEQGVEGPPGPRGEPGINGAAVAAEGQYAFDVDADGHLWLYYTGGEAPEFSLEDDGHLYLNFVA